MTGTKMIKNIIEIFGVDSSYAYQIKNIVYGYDEEYAKIFYNTMLEGERTNLETQIINLQAKLDKLNDMI